MKELKLIDAMEFKVGDHVKVKVNNKCHKKHFGYVFKINYISDSGKICREEKGGLWDTDILTLCLPEKWAIKTDRQEFWDYYKDYCDTKSSEYYHHFPAFGNIESEFGKYHADIYVYRGYTEISFEYWCRVHRPDLLEKERGIKIINASEIPEKWCVRRTPENADVLEAWFGAKVVEANDWYLCYNKLWNKRPYINHYLSLGKLVEITYEQWQTIPEVTEWLQKECDKELAQAGAQLIKDLTEEETKNLDNLYSMYDFVTNSEEKTLFSVSVHPKPEEREIIGYKAPFDMYEGEVKKGDVYQKSISDPNLYFSVNYDEYLPAEWVETWDPVYKEAPKPVWERFPTWESIVPEMDGFYLDWEGCINDFNHVSDEEAKFKKDVMATKKHVESALAFSQLSQIEKTWNEGKKGSWTVKYDPEKDGLKVIEVFYKAHINFATQELAMKSIELPAIADLWRKFWMV